MLMQELAIATRLEGKCMYVDDGGVILAMSRKEKHMYVGEERPIAARLI